MLKHPTGAEIDGAQVLQGVADGRRHEEFIFVLMDDIRCARCRQQDRPTRPGERPAYQCLVRIEHPKRGVLHLGIVECGACRARHFIKA